MLHGHRIELIIIEGKVKGATVLKMNLAFQSN